MNIFRNKDKKVVTEKAAEHLSGLLIETKRSPTLLLLSSGSSFEILKYIHPELLGGYLTVTVLDERYSLDPTVNNFSQLMMTEFYQIAYKNGSSFIDTRVRKGETIEELTGHFEAQLREWVEKNGENNIIATQGVGPDGHTAGVMPYPDDSELFRKLFDDPRKWIIGYDATIKRNKYPLRVTATITFLRDFVKHSICYMCGEEKKEALKKIFSEKGNLWETPARILREMKEVEIFTDIVD